MAETTGSVTARQTGRYSRIGVAVSVIIIAALVWFGIRNALPGLPSAPAVTDRVVVAPFANGTGDADLAFVGRIAADWITVGLQRLGQAVVPTPDAVRAAHHVEERVAAGSDVDSVGLLAAEARARIVISGAYRLERDSLRFEVRISDARGALPLVVLEPVTAPVSSPDDALDALRERVIAHLSGGAAGRLSATAAADAPPTLESYRAFSEGMERFARDEHRVAARHFGRAFSLDSTAVIALVWAALSHARLAEWAQTDSIVMVAESMSGRLPESQRAWLGYAAAQARGDHEAALRAIGPAWERAPESMAAYDLAFAAMQTNRPVLALNTLVALDGDSGPMRGWFPYWTVLTDALHRTGNHARELTMARRARELFPSAPEGAALEAAALAALARRDELYALLDEAMRVGGNDVATGRLLRVAATELRAHDQRSAADSVLARALVWFDSRPDSVRETADFLHAYAAVLEDGGEVGRATAIVESLAAGSAADWYYIGWLGRLAAERGDTAAATSAADRLAEIAEPYTFGGPIAERGRILGRLGAVDDAIDLLRQARSRGWTLPRHPGLVFSELAGVPAFDRLMQPPD